MTATYGLTSIRTLREAQISIGFIKVYSDFFPGLLISGLFICFCINWDQIKLLYKSRDHLNIKVVTRRLLNT